MSTLSCEDTVLAPGFAVVLCISGQIEIVAGSSFLSELGCFMLVWEILLLIAAAAGRNLAVTSFSASRQLSRHHQLAIQLHFRCLTTPTSCIRTG